MNDIHGPMDAVSRLYQQLDEKITSQGGLGNILGMNRRLREAMAALNSNDLVILLREIDRARQALDTLKVDIGEIHALKEALELAPPRIV